MSKIHIVQHGFDGFGHQLHGLYSCLLLHNIKNYIFDGWSFINKKYHFGHIHGRIHDEVRLYMIEIVKQFMIQNNMQEQIQYKKHIHSHEIYKIPIHYDSNTLYSLDNAYYFDKIPINKEERLQHTNNMKKIKPFFINNKLPKNRLDNNNIVIHFRQGDAMEGRGIQINQYNKQLLDLMNILVKKYSNYTYYLHTDGDIEFFTSCLDKNNINYKLFLKSEPVLNVLSDFIHSKIFISGISGLSTVCSFLGNHELIIVSDSIKHSLPDNIVRISNYIDNNSL